MTSMIKTNVFFDFTDFQLLTSLRSRAVLAEALSGYVFVVHVGGTRCATFRTDHIMKIRARITLTVEFIRGYIFKFLFYV